MSLATISRLSDAFQLNEKEIYRIMEITRSGGGAEPYASVTEPGANNASGEPTAADEGDGLHIAADLAMTYQHAVTLGARLAESMPEDLFDVDLGPEE